MEKPAKTDFCVETASGTIVNVKAQPRSSRSAVAGVLGGALKVNIRSAPVDGKANKELVECIAKAFGVPKSRVEFVSGETSKTKRLFVRGVSAADAVAVAEKGSVK